MLTVRFISADNVGEIYAKLGLEKTTPSSDFVMFDEAEPVALMRMRIAIEDEPVGIIEQIFFKDEVEEDDRTFFLHAMMFKLREGSPIRLRYLGVWDRLKKFGFEEADGNLEIYSGDINLYYNCGGKH